MKLTKYGSWAVVTGASDGVGKAIAQQIATQGLNLVLVARRAAILDQMANEYRDRYHIKVEVVQLTCRRQKLRTQYWMSLRIWMLGYLSLVPGLDHLGH